MTPERGPGWARGAAALAAALLVAATLMMALDLVFLGVLAKPFYDAALGPLRAAEVYWPAALTFYAFYVLSVVAVAVLPTRSASQAAWRGAGLGLFGYAVYELTNWAVIAGWPARMVPVDIAWGVALTAAVAGGTRAAIARLVPSAPDWMRPFEVHRLPGESWLAVWGRRALSIPLVLLLLAVVLATAPAWLLLAAAWDLAVGPRGRWNRVRGLTFFAWYLLCEALGLATAAILWLGTAGGRIVGDERYVEYHVALQRRWTDALLFGSLRIFAMRLEVDGAELGAEGPYAVWVRHVSTSDTVLTAAVLANPHRLALRYVLKDALLWDPCLDVVGRRLPNAFVRRGSGDAGPAIAAIERLAEGLDARSAVLIYPEGTRFSPSQRARALERLAERGEDELLALAADMQHVLPPRLGGVLAIMEAAPELDVVTVAHTGLEGARTFSEFWSGGLVGQTLRVVISRTPPPKLPPEARPRWVFEQWQRVDAWVADHEAPKAGQRR